MPGSIACENRDMRIKFPSLGRSRGGPQHGHNAPLGHGVHHMQARRPLSALCAAALLAATLSAQSPNSDIDAHISAAKTAAGLDYRATFVNLCFPGANPALANPAAGRAGGAA